VRADEHPLLELIACELDGDQRAKRHDVVLLEEVVRGANGTLPDVEQALTVRCARRTDARVRA